MPRAGIVTVVGKPNVGKSTLLNRVVGIHTSDDAQMVILDTPGLLNPRYPLQEAMKSTALRALEDADVIVYLADATEGPPPPLATAAELAKQPTAPIITVLNKSDALGDGNHQPGGEDAEMVLISALTGDGVPEL